MVPLAKPLVQKGVQLWAGCLPALLATGMCADFTGQGSYLGFLLMQNQRPTVFRVIVSEVSGATQVTEAGAGAEYRISLSDEPSAPVTISISFDTGQLTVDGQSVSPQSVTLTDSCPGATCWSSGVAVALAAVNDAVTEGPHVAQLGHSVNSTDLHYDGAPVASLAVSIQDRRRIFMTASAKNPPNVGLAALDALCNASANRPTLDPYKALLGASTRRACTTANCSGGAVEHQAWVLKPGTSYYGGDGLTLIGQTKATAGIFTFPLAAAWAGAGAAHTWSGLNADWTNAVDSCADWTSLLANGEGGVLGFTTIGAIAGGSRACSATWPSLVCVAQ